VSLSDALTLLVIFVAVPVNWFVTWRLWVLSRRSPAWVLRDRFWIAFAISVIVTVFAVVFVNNSLTPPWLNGEQTKIITRSAVLVLSTLTAFYWLVRSRRESRVDQGSE
jgi:ABC-type sulfate transport system permease subunit